MRLSNYITEITEPTVTPAIGLIHSAMPELYRILSKHNWDVTDEMFIKILNGVFKKHKIMFDLNIGRASIKKFIGWGGYILGGKVIVNINPFKASKYLRRFAKKGKYSDFFSISKNQFLGDLFDVLAHEYIHAMQDFKSKGKFVIYGDDEKDKDYLSDKNEVEAFAQQAAIELTRFGKSETIRRYMATFDENSPIYKRFFKRLYFYIRKGI